MKKSSFFILYKILIAKKSMNTWLKLSKLQKSMNAIKYKSRGLPLSIISLLYNYMFKTIYYH